MSPHQKITDQRVAGLPIGEGRAELLEEIMQSTATPDHSYRGLLVPLAAAAAVVAVVGGAWTLSNGDDPDTSPRGPGFGSEPSGTTAPPSTEPATPTAPASNTCVVMYDVGEPTPATDGPELADCDEVILDEQQPGDVVQEERYQRPPRPVLITAEGWEVEGVYNMGLDWVGPGGAEVHLDWVQSDNPDPFAYDRYDRAGERIEILGVEGRLTGFSQQGKAYQVLLTSPVRVGGPGLLLETSSLGPVAFRRLVESLEWVELAAYEAVVRPAAE